MVKPTRPPAPCRGYKLKGREGAWREVWEVSETLRKRGYQPSNVRLHYPDTPHGRALAAARCEQLTAQAKVWAGAGEQFPRRSYDGSIGALCRAYETDPDSPFQALKDNSKTTIAHYLGIVAKTVGARQVRVLIGTDFRAWHRKWGEPAKEGGKKRPARARHCIVITRRVIGYGVTLGYADCARASAILREMRFKILPPREVKLTREYAVAVINAADEIGLHSIALATAMQFSLGLRQKDVIGEWSRAGEWSAGVAWEDIDAAMVLRKRTTKTGAPVEHDLNLSPLVLSRLAGTPVDARSGPLVVSERTRCPWRASAFGVTWRRIARAAGVPDAVQNRDARSGAITEAYEIGAEETDVMKFAGHRNRQTSTIYNRGALAQSSRVSRLRLVETKGEDE